MIKEYLNWEVLDRNWEDIDINWEDIYIIIEVQRRTGGGQGLQEYIKNNPWDKLRKDVGEEKAKKFIKIFCKINDLEYEKVIEPNSKIKVKASQFERVFQSVPNIKFKN